MIEIGVKSDAELCEPYVERRGKLLPDAAHRQARRCPGVGWVTLNDDDAARKAVFQKMVGDTGSDDAATDDDDVRDHR